MLHAAVACPVPSASRWPGPSRLHVTSITRISPALGTLSLLQSTHELGALPVFSASKRLRLLLHTTNPTRLACLLPAIDDEQRRPSSRERIGLGLSFASLFHHRRHHPPVPSLSASTESTRALCLHAWSCMPAPRPDMHKISNFTGQARHGWEKMTPSMGFGMSRPHQQDMSVTPPPLKRPMPGNAMPGVAMGPNPTMPGGHLVNISFNVPFNSNLPGPDKEDVLYSSLGAFQKWTHPDGAADDTPVHALPVHTRNVENLRSLCKQVSDGSGDRLHATVTSSKPKPVPGMQRGPLTALVTNVCVSGDSEIVHKMRQKLLNETPITLVRGCYRFTRKGLHADIS